MCKLYTHDKHTHIYIQTEKKLCILCNYVKHTQMSAASGPRPICHAWPDVRENTIGHIFNSDLRAKVSFATVFQERVSNSQSCCVGPYLHPSYCVKGLCPSTLGMQFNKQPNWDKQTTIY